MHALQPFANSGIDNNAVTIQTYEFTRRAEPWSAPIAPAALVVPAVVSPITPTPLRHRSKRPIRAWHAGLILLLITGFGAALRFYHLTFPTLWSDESLVYWRVCGTYRDMLGPLTTDGFPPLHYSLYWLIGHYFKLTPWVMRLPAAIAGTLTISAMYFLARQMLPRKTSLLAAAFTACSAFMLFYSRDAKMYPDTWLFVTLNLACLLWWLRTGASTAWFGWIAAGCLMVGLHASAFAIVAISPLLLLSQPRLHWKKAVLMTLGILLIVSGPIGYFTKFNHWNQDVDQRGWGASGIGWVNWYNGHRTGPELVRYASTAFLNGWEWPRDDYLTHIDPPLYTGPRDLSVELLALLGIAALPWPLIWRPKRELDPPPQPQWRVAFWIAILTVVPGYGYYCHSIRYFFSPLRWIYESRLMLPPTQWEAIGIAVAGFVLASLTFAMGRRMLLRGLQWVLAMAVVLAFLQALFYACYTIAAGSEYDHHPWSSVWTPRYLGIIWPGVCLGVAALLMRLPTRAVRFAVILFFLGANLTMASLRMTLATQPPIDRIAADIWAAQPKNATVRTYIHIYDSNKAVAGASLYTMTGKYYLEMQSNHKPMSPWLLESSLSHYRLWTQESVAVIATQVANDHSLKRLITWNQVQPNIENHTDRLEPRLKGWKLVSETWYPVRIVWDWRLRWSYLRREYVRSAH